MTDLPLPKDLRTLPVGTVLRLRDGSLATITGANHLDGIFPVRVESNAFVIGRDFLTSNGRYRSPSITLEPHDWDAVGVVPFEPTKQSTPVPEPDTYDANFLLNVKGAGGLASHPVQVSLVYDDPEATGSPLEILVNGIRYFPDPVQKPVTAGTENKFFITSVRTTRNPNCLTFEASSSGPVTDDLWSEIHTLYDTKNPIFF